MLSEINHYEMTNEYIIIIIVDILNGSLVEFQI